MEKTGVAVPVDDIIDVYFGELNEDGLTQEEEAELAAIQKQFEDEEEAKFDAEIAEQEREEEERLAKKQQQKQEESQVSPEMQDKLTIIRNVVIVTFVIIFVIFLYLVSVFANS